jgi:hypothetical protein
MKNFGGFFKKKRMDKLLKNAGNLFPSAHILAIGSYTPWRDKYAVIGQIDSKQWDFVLTVSGVFVAITQLSFENISDGDKDTLLHKITGVAIETYPDFVEACEDCGKFVDRNIYELAKEYQGNEPFIFSLGTWVVWNLFGHAPSSEDEWELVRQIGAFLINALISWWK